MVTAARSRRARRGQTGYVLGIVLAAMVVGMTMITALLGLSFATHASAISQQSLARELRASDGALEVGVNQLKQAVDPEALCTAGLEPVPMQLSSNPADADEQVTLDCLVTPDATPNVTGGVKILGDSYEGTALDPPLDGLADEVTLRHQGDEPLAFVGNVRVSGGAAVDADGPGARVSGTYVQGLPDSGTACGELSPASPDPRRHLIDSDGGGEPTCGDPNVTGQGVPHVDLPQPGPVLSIPGCAPGGQVTLLPGYYSPAAVEVLNVLLACDAAVFSFSPSGAGDVFWFDAGEAGSVQFAASAAYVFGTLAGSECDPASPGVTVVLGAGTGIAHTAGNVSICGEPTHATPALVQSTAATRQPTLANLTGFPGNVGSSLVGPANKDLLLWRYIDLNSSSREITGTVSYPGGGPVKTMSLRFKSWEDPPSFELNRWVEVRLTSSDTTAQCGPLPSTGDRGRVDDMMSVEINLDSCIPQFGAAASLDGANISIVMKPLTAPSVASRLYVADLELVVNSETVAPTSVAESSGWNDVDALLAPTPAPNPSGSYAYADQPRGCVYQLLWPHMCPRPSAGSPETFFTLDFSDHVAPDGRADEAVSSIAVALDMYDLPLGFSPAAGFNITAFRNSPKAGKTVVTLSKNGQSKNCVAFATYARSRQTVVLDLDAKLSTPGSTHYDQDKRRFDCWPGLELGDIKDIDIKVAITPEDRTYLGPTPYSAGVEVPWVDYARAIVTTEAMLEPPDLSITVDDDGGSSFHVHGDTIAPDMNVDIRWMGGASRQPLFSGELAVWSIGSSGTPDSSVGVVCCGTDYASVAITAELPDAPEIRGLARVRFEADPKVTDWQLCDRSGCTVELVGLNP